MKPLYVRVDKNEGSFTTAEVYVRTGQHTATQRDLYITIDDSGKLKINLSDIVRPMVRCRACGKLEYSEIANGHIMIEEPDVLLCAMCANTEEIFNRYVDFDEEGNYKLKVKP